MTSIYKPECLRHIIPVLFAWALFSQASLLFGQNTARTPNDVRKQRGLQIEAAFKPAFFCKPAVQRIEARKGQTVNFEFRMEPVRENVSITVRPVALRQFVTGALRADLEGPPPAGMVLNGSRRYDLQIGEEAVLRGTVKVPANDSDFHSFGILVEDNGYLPDNNRRGVDEVTYGVKFVSQYILRCDINVTNGRGTDIEFLQIESSGLVERNGVPSAEVFIYNPSQSVIEFKLQSKLTRPGYVEGKKDVNLFAPVNSSKNEPEKYSTRIFPESRIKMVSDWPNAVFPGEFEMETKVLRDRKAIFVARSQLSIGDDSFPAQSTFAAQVSNGVHVHPAQLFLSQERGAKKFVPVHLTNFSTEEVTLVIQPIDKQGNRVDWLLVRPQQVTVKPGANRKALLSVKSLSDRENHRMAFLSIQNESAENNDGCTLPVAFKGTGRFSPTIATNSMRINNEVEGGAFVVDVMNQSELPVPVNATIQFDSSTGNKMTAQAGYGKWLLPGEQRRLNFQINTSVAEGKLPVSFVLTDSVQKLIAKRTFDLDINSDSIVASEPDQNRNGVPARQASVRTDGEQDNADGSRGK